MIQKKFTIAPNPHLAIPAISFQPDKEESHSVVFLLHGLSVCKETQIPDLKLLAENGFCAISIDAPHHGDRKTGLTEFMQGLSKRDSHQLLLTIVQQQVSELEAITDLYRRKLGKKVAIAGISMGGFSTFGALKNNTQPDALIPFLGSPSWKCPARESDETISILESSGPADTLKEIPGTPLLIVNAGKDKIVPAESSRKFFHALQDSCGNSPISASYFEYPESSHMMRPEDWYNAWDKVTDFLKRLNF